jgi:chitodextrinase
MKREEAKAIIAALVTMRDSATDEQALAAPALYPAWRSGAAYKTGQRVMFEGTLYKVLQDHEAQAQWTPTGAPSLFAKVLIPVEGGVFAWEQPDSTNPYMKGDKVTHNGQTWESLVDNNVWEPTEANATLWAVVEEAE